MKKMISLLVLLGLMACVQQPKENNRVTFIEDLLDDFMTAVQEYNYEELDKLTDKDFMMFENGRIWNTKEFLQALEGYQDVKITYDIEKIDIILEQNTAHAHFLNHGTFVYPDTTIYMNFIESCTFKKNDDIWYLHYYYSTHLK